MSTLISVTQDLTAGDHWERTAEWWQIEFTDGADAEYEEQILPLAKTHLAGAARVLDVGCGEGQVGRVACAAGSRVVGLDPTWSQLVVAKERAGGPAYLQGSGGSLPFATGSFDGAVACLVVEHIADVDGVIAEIARVLEPGGRFVLFVNHPLLQTPGSGWIDDHILMEQYWRIGPYLTEDTTMEEVANGVILPFVHRPLSRYINALADHGLFVTHMEEPAPPPGFLEAAQEYQDAASIPRLLLLRAEKLAREA
ncbi:MAG: class I SAM-dependent methyltransferase [Acidimicrobiales bacterium]